jgi:hypothetical protein
MPDLTARPKMAAFKDAGCLYKFKTPKLYFLSILPGSIKTSIGEWKLKGEK